MKHRILPAMLFVVLLATICSAAEIGIYFDTAATINCLPEVSTFPYATQAYVIATNCAGSGGALGWEAGLAWDSTLNISAVSVSGQPINVRAFPEYLVELASPLPGNQAVVLAEVDVVASGPGGIFVRGLNTSKPGSMSVIAPGGTSNPEPMTYAYGDAQSHVATIGLSSCPEFATQIVQIAEEVPLGEETATVWGDPGREASLRKDVEVYDGGPNAAAAFAGTIVSAELKCAELPFRPVAGMIGPGTLLELTVDVTDRYWGRVPDVAIVRIVGYELAGCTRNKEDWGLPPISLVVPQARCFLTARSEGGTFVVTASESFRLIDSAKADDLRRKILSRFEQYSDESQMRAAAVIVDAERIPYQGRSGADYRVVRRIKGSAGDTLFVQSRDDNGAWFYQGDVGHLARLYLAEDERGLYPLHGHYSVQKIRGVDR